MRVLMFGWEYPPHNSGGLGVACQGLAKALARENAKIIFVLPKQNHVSDDSVSIVFAGVPEITTRPIYSSLTPYVTSTSYMTKKNLHSWYGSNLFEEVMRYGELAWDLAQTLTFDVIHAHDWLSYPAGVAAKEATGKPLVVHVHATEFDRSRGSINQEVYEIEKEGMEKADTVIAVSEFTKNIIVEHYGVSADKVEVVHNGIEQNNAPCGIHNGLSALKKRGSKIVLFVGRLTTQKGPDYFVRAAHKVLQVLPDTYFVVAGSGDMEKDMMEEAAARNISDRFLFVGFLRGEELNAVYALADVFVMPSVSEPFGITTLEAMMHKTPVIISKQSGVSEVVSHALKVDFWDIDEMAEEIVAVLSYRALSATLAQNGLQQVKTCTWDKAAKQCMGVYKKMGVTA